MGIPIDGALARLAGRHRQGNCQGVHCVILIVHIPLLRTGADFDSKLVVIDQFLSQEGKSTRKAQNRFPAERPKFGHGPIIFDDLQ